jgi:hypothetical protein
MAIIVVPTRIIPGCLLGGLFAGIGLFSSAGVSIMIAQHRFAPLSLAAAPLLAFAIWFIHHVWRRGAATANVSKVTSLSPRLLSVILLVSLLVGVATGIMFGMLTAE